MQELEVFSKYQSYSRVCLRVLFGLDPRSVLDRNYVPYIFCRPEPGVWAKVIRKGGHIHLLREME
jgi:hypothetical protein